MTREEIITSISEKLKLLRLEFNYTQDRMSEIIGISKKTLVQIEKERIAPSWTAIVAICAIFRESATIQETLGSDPLEIIETVSRDEVEFRKEKTLGGKLWWKEIENKSGFILQQNLLSKHYRILDEDFFRIYSTFEEKEARKRFNELLLQSR